MLAKDDSDLMKFLAVEDKYFQQSIPVSIVLTGEEKYQESTTQEEISKLSSIVKENSYFQSKCISWMDALRQFSKAKNINISGPNFMPALRNFIKIPRFSGFKQDVKLSSNESQVLASRVVAFMDPTMSICFLWETIGKHHI